MPRIAKVNIYTRIIDTSLTLFSEEGERNIDTNHAAAHLDISPGNLYYHFRNKDEIIVQLFKRYSEVLLAYFSEAVLPSNVGDSINYMTGIYDVVWEYRFLFSDVNTLLARSTELLNEHNTFTQAKVSPLSVNLLTQLSDLSTISADQTAMDDLAVNMQVVAKYWLDFGSPLRGHVKLIEDPKVRDVSRTLNLSRPYLLLEHRTGFD